MSTQKPELSELQKAKQRMREHHWRATWSAIQIQRMYMEIAKDSPPGSFHKHDAKQAFYDSLTSMRMCGLIEDIHLVDGKIKCQDYWWGLNDIPKRYLPRFRPTPGIKPIRVT